MALLATKLYIPQPGKSLVPRPRLLERLNEGMDRMLTLVSAPAGFGKTTLLSEWVHDVGRKAAWFSIDQGDNDPARFLSYLTAAMQTLHAGIGEGLPEALQSPQPPSAESVMTTLLNDIASIPNDFILVLDDYHAIDSNKVDEAVAFLLEHMPRQMHLIIATREDPRLPLARFRARGQLSELRVKELRFTPDEAAAFLNSAMGLSLSPGDVSLLETRTEGWISGLQLAAVSMRGNNDYASFIQSFTGNNHFVLDYLAEEVLQRQPENVQNFLLRTSILDRMCGPLCDALLDDPGTGGQRTIEYLERANLFIIPLDNERRWYRYHHLFADLLRQRLRQCSTASDADERMSMEDLHSRASRWCEENGFEIEAFRHAAASNDIDRTERLMLGSGMPLHMRGAAFAVLEWLGSLPPAVLDKRPSLLAAHASILLVTGQTTGVEEKLRAAETALRYAALDDGTKALLGQIAATRATLALTGYKIEQMIEQALLALEYLHGNMPFRPTALWILGYAYQFKGERSASYRAFQEALLVSRALGDTFTEILALSGLALVQESQNQLYSAAETCHRVIALLGEYPQPNACEIYLSLARISYEWNDFEAAERYGQQSLRMARQYEKGIDRDIISEVFLARVAMARGELEAAASMLEQTEKYARCNQFVHRLAEIAETQVLLFLKKGDSDAAEDLALKFDSVPARARVLLARGKNTEALALLETMQTAADGKEWEDERLKTMILQALAMYAQGETGNAVRLMGDILAMAEPGGFIRSFIDEGKPMAALLREAASQGIMKAYANKLLDDYQSEVLIHHDKPASLSVKPLYEPLSQREMDVLKLVADGFSNHDISEKLFLALDTVKGHNRRIFEKLQVQRRTEAVARARELGLI